MEIYEKTPPAFIWCTAGDKAVPPAGSFALAEAYINAGVPVELMLYPYGPHGISLATEFTSHDRDGFVQPLAEGWVDAAYKFIRSLPEA